MAAFVFILLCYLLHLFSAFLYLLLYMGTPTTGQFAHSDTPLTRLTADVILVARPPVMFATVLLPAGARPPLMCHQLISGIPTFTPPILGQTPARP